MVLQKALLSASLREIKEDLKALFLVRFKGSGFKLPRILYTDMCCDDRELMIEIFGELRQGGHDFTIAKGVPLAPELPVFDLSDVQVGCVRASTNSQVVVGAVDLIRGEAEANSRVLGFDIEWKMSLAGSPANPPATIQLAAGKQVVIFHVVYGQRGQPKKLPASLVGLLEDGSIVKAGVGISGDCTRLRKFYDVEVENAVDLSKMALSRKIELGLRRGLADMCNALLGLHLPKDRLVRVSDWSKPTLTEEQKR